MDKENQEIVDEVVNENTKWLEEGESAPQEEVADTESDYEFELFLSTDGKNTVHVKANRKNANKALKAATETYDYIKARYGTKQALSVKEYGNGKAQEVSQQSCKHTNVAFKESKTEKNPGRWFKSCKDCKAFLGWKS